MTAVERNAMVERLIPLAQKLASVIASRVAAPFREYVLSDGYVGLIQAVDSFDPTHGVPIEAWAKRVITGKMLNGVRSMDFVPERARRAHRDGENLRHSIASQRGSFPTVAETNALCPGFAKAVRTVEQVGQMMSLDAPLPQAIRHPNDGSDTESAVENAMLWGLVSALPKREREIIVRHYCLGESLREISKGLALSPQRLSQLHTRAVRLLRQAMGAA